MEEHDRCSPIVRHRGHVLRYCPPAIVLLVAIVATNPVRAKVPDLQVDQLATGPYSRMHMLLEKTLLAVDVLTVEVRFDESTRQQFLKLVHRGGGSDELVGRIADAAVRAGQVFIRLEFKRDVSLNRWVEAVRDSLAKAWRSGLIDEESFRHVSGNLPLWFRGIAQRGFKAGDQILYRGYPDGLRTVLASADGHVLLDQTDRGAASREALLGGYFAPGTDFREPLVRSMLQP
jgi:hypothetical protein